MDSLTHIAIGACIGELCVGKAIGKKAMLWGALAQSIPDIDFVAAIWMKPAEALLAHRGFTHSILFAVIIVPLFALLADRLHRPHDVSTKRWLWFFGISVLGHLFLDGFNNYGVGWLVPFSKERFSFNTIYVADFLFSVWPGIALLGLLFVNKHNSRRVFWAASGMILPALYLLYGIYNKLAINSSVKVIAQKEHIVYKDYFTTPTPLNNLLWYVVLKSDSGYYIGYRSVFDKKDTIPFCYFAQKSSLPVSMAAHEELDLLTRFSRGFYHIEQRGDTLVFNDLQFGQVAGWRNPHAPFVFYYFLSHPGGNRLVVQRGRLEGWNKETVASLIRRIAGDTE